MMIRRFLTEIAKKQCQQGYSEHPSGHDRHPFVPADYYELSVMFRNVAAPFCNSTNSIHRDRF